MPQPDEIPIRPRHFRTPQGDGETLIEPKFVDAYSRLSQKRPANHSADAWLFSKSIDFYKHDASSELFSKALRYSKAYRDFELQFSTGCFDTKNILAGHQPTLFHPGVWLKNFVLRQAQPGINLVVDNDVAGDASIRIPSGTHLQPGLEGFALDEPYENVPFEERPIVSTSAVKNFACRLQASFDSAKWFSRASPTTLLAEQLAQYLEIPRQGKAHLPLGETFARARHRLEQDFGLQTLELPLRVVTQSGSFRLFALHLMLHAKRFQEIYNRSLTEYRIVNKIRSHSHPVPALVAENLSLPDLSIRGEWLETVEGEWLEAPFWIWTKSNPRRRRLFIRQTRMNESVFTIAFTDRREIAFSMMGSHDERGAWFHQWRGVEEQGIKIRPRALITTMYARLFLSDLFIHGIGGAKYDELTDAIIRRFFGIEPPAYMTVTGTVRLPIPRPDVSAADVLGLKQLIREIRFHPEKFVNDLSPALRASATEFAAKKAELLRQHQFHFRGASAEQFRALDDLNRQLHVLLTDVEIRLRDELKSRERELHAAKILGSREFSFVLHPADTLPEQLKRMAACS